MPIEVLLSLVVVGGALTQGVTGFGFGLVVMSVLPHVVDIRTAVPVVAVLGLLVSVTVLWRWRRHVQPREVLPPLAGVLAGTPIGVLFLTSVDPRVVTATLGVVLVGYGGGRLLGEVRGAGSSAGASSARLPGPGWGTLAGACGGMIGGAFNTGGPPIIVYATARQWSPSAFKANLQVVFLVSTAFQLSLLAARGAVTSEVLELDLVALPALLVGVGAGTLLTRHLDATVFRRVVLVLLLVFGVAFLVRAATG